MTIKDENTELFNDTEVGNTKTSLDGMLRENSSCLGTFSILRRELTFPLIFTLELAEVSLETTLKLTNEGNIAHFVVRFFYARQK